MPSIDEPPVAIRAGNLIVGEIITLPFAFGGALVLVGVWIGALMPFAR